MKKILLGILLSLSHVLNAQELKSITFNEKSHDFGVIKEEGGLATFDFIFKNTGLKPIKILSVKASCGCTTPDWTKEELLSGETGFIKVDYSPLNRPGVFKKTLTVTTSLPNDKTIILHINGKVEPKPRTVEDDLPILLGGIRVKYRTLNMGKIMSNQVGIKEFDVYNASEKPIIFTKNIEAPPYIKVSFLPDHLAVSKKGKIIVEYDAKTKDDLGFMTENIVFTTDEAGENSRKNMSVYANINEYFPPMTEEETLNAPHLKLEHTIYNFGTIYKNQSNSLSTSFTLINTGKNKLEIRKLSASCGCVIPSLEVSTLSQGDTAKLNVIFNTTGRKGSQIKTVAIYTNDPLRPIQKITLKALISTKNKY